MCSDVTEDKSCICLYRLLFVCVDFGQDVYVCIKKTKAKSKRTLESKAD